jgi:hypothetical protein
VISFSESRRKVRTIALIPLVPLSRYWNDNCGERSAVATEGQPFALDLTK